MEIGPGIFFARAPDENFSRRTGMEKEQAQLRMTLLLIKDWDGFQLAMHAMMHHFQKREKAVRRGDR
ncbi:MAG: hypothetical protein AMJ60_03840 [Desulfobacterales bacterium SG8_35]|nr:MAG: hypothetical protein AMJ60_03840 [Desulfobacterales bacterium SG8_35]